MKHKRPWGIGFLAIGVLIILLVSGCIEAGEPVLQFPIFRNEINVSNYYNCLEEREDEFSVQHHPGNLIINFGDDVMVEEARELLIKYNLGTDDIVSRGFNVWGTIDVNPEYELNYMCELVQYDIVSRVDVNMILHAL